MRQRLRRQVWSVVCVVALVAAWSGLPVGAQAPVKRPISYDTMDYWRSIGGTRLSDDGQWLAYALSSQGEDGELVVRNLATGKEFKHPRGTTPVFTPDAKFVLFTIVPPKTNADDDAAAGRAGGAGGEAAEGAAATAAARNSAGIMALPSGQVTVVEQISTIRLAEDSSVWVALHKGRAPAAGGRGGRGGGGGRGAGGGRAGGRNTGRETQGCRQ
jgi:hypothetical protein